MKKIIFMGTPPFAAEILKGLILQSPYEVVAVVTQPDRPIGRKRTLTPPPVKALALEYGIPVYQPEKLGKSEELELLIALEADLIITAAYGQFVPTRLIQSKPYSAINVHASLLPKYRGGAPIHYAIWKGDQETGISIIYMTKKMDAGDVLAIRPCPIEPTDNVGILFDKLAILGRELLLDTLFRLFNHEIVAMKQNEEDVIYSPTITREQEQIQWQQSAQEIDCHVRAFTPFPTTYTHLNGERVKIWLGHPVEHIDSNTHTPGTIIAVKRKQLIVACGANSYYAIKEWQLSGKKRSTIEDYMKGNDATLLIGQQFTFVAPEIPHEN